MSMSITDFLLARIAEDEAVARSQSFANWDALEADAIDTGGYLLTISPARVLRECAAKRAIIEAAEESSGALSYLNPLAAIYSDRPDHQEGWQL